VETVKCITTSMISLSEELNAVIIQDNVQRTRSLSNANSNALQDISIQIYMATTLTIQVHVTSPVT